MCPFHRVPRMLSVARAMLPDMSCCHAAQSGTAVQQHSGVCACVRACVWECVRVSVAPVC